MNAKYNIRNLSSSLRSYIYFRPTDPITTQFDDIKMLLEDEDTFTVLPTSEGYTTTNSYKLVTEYIYRIITKSNFLCKGLNPKYVLNAFNEVDAILVISDGMDLLPNGNIYGFALIQFNETRNAIHIDTICSHIGIQYAGDFLLNDIEKMCKKVFMREIYLKSVKVAIPFYEKYGFVKTDASCENMCEMVKQISRSSGGKRQRHRKKYSVKKMRRKRRYTMRK